MSNTDDIFTRRGRLEITSEAIRKFPKELKRYVFSKLIIVRCEHMGMTDTYEYYAYCNAFEEADRATKVPTYNIEIVKNEKGKVIKVNFIKVEGE